MGVIIFIYCVPEIECEITDNDYMTYDYMTDLFKNLLLSTYKQNI